MIDKTLARGLFLVAISLVFGLTALRYPIGDFSRAGPGLFPVVISSMLLLIGIATVVRSRFVETIRLEIQLRNIGIILASLCTFAVLTIFVNMLVAIVAMVFVAAIAGTNYSWKRNVKVALGLCLMALVFSRLLGMNLPLY